MEGLGRGLTNNPQSLILHVTPPFVEVMPENSHDTYHEEAETFLLSNSTVTYIWILNWTPSKYTYDALCISKSTSKSVKQKI